MPPGVGGSPHSGSSRQLKCQNVRIQVFLVIQIDYASAPKKQLPPVIPLPLPCPATEENMPLIKQFIIDTYASSAFNICSHQPLPLMSGSEPLRLHIIPAVKPVAIRMPS